MLYFLDSRADSDFRSNRPKIIRLWSRCEPIIVTEIIFPQRRNAGIVDEGNAALHRDLPGEHKMLDDALLGPRYAGKSHVARVFVKARLSGIGNINT